MEYQKIQSVFLRDVNNVIMPKNYTYPEFKYLENCKFEATEKIDGTNQRIELSYDGSKFNIEFKGRTENSDIPTPLINKMHQLFDSIKWEDIFTNIESGTKITIYGEGYGNKIQKVGKKYIDSEVNFILFDVKIGNWWLNRKNCEDIARKLNIKIVPLVGYFTILEAIEYVKKGFKSNISEDRTLMAEGLVLKTPDGLCRRNGERIVLKIKTCDFVKFKNKYGDNWDIEQTPNPKYMSPE